MDDYIPLEELSVKAWCKICHGPIGNGEPVVSYDDGLAHRFRKTCEDYKARAEQIDAEFLAGMKIQG